VILRFIESVLGFIFGGREEPERKPSPSREKGGLTGVRNVVGYTLRSRRDKILYVGITNHPEARAEEHWDDGKRFSHLQVETRPMSRAYARKWEAKRLASYRRFTGYNPMYNYTDDGGFHGED